MRHQFIQITEAPVDISVSISTTHAETGALDCTDATVFSTVDCYCAKGSSPQATTSHRFIPANQLIGIGGWKVGEKLSFVTASGTGTVHISPGA